MGLLVLGPISAQVLLPPSSSLSFLWLPFQPASDPDNCTISSFVVLDKCVGETVLVQRDIVRSWMVNPTLPTTVATKLYVAT